MNYKELDKKYIANTYGRFDLVMDSGTGSRIYDANGQDYIDLGTGIAVNIFGACDIEWIKAVGDQMMKLQHTSNLYYSAPQIMLAELMCTKTDMEKVFFSNSGAEANECAIKTARKYSSDKYGEGRSTIVTLKNSFHGRTLTTLSATGQDVFHKHFGPFTDGFRFAEPDNIASLRECIKDDVCAVMMELVQGESGVNPLDAAFVAEAAEICRDKDILLIIDEVQTGNGRTGKLYSYMNYGIKPDIFTTAKGLGGGLPIGATVFGEKTASVLGAGDHGSTFGGNPMSCAGAYSILSRIDDKLMEGVKERHDIIVQELSGAKGIIGVYGLGLMLGVEVEGDAKAIAAKCLENRVIVLTAKSRVRLLPALNIPLDELREALGVLKTVAASEAK